jgi:predicted CXXCH cytochrome family protein
MRTTTFIAVLLLTPVAPAQLLTVSQSQHNLSVSGPGPVKSTSESGVCIFCHAPHSGGSAKALWNKQLPANNYQPYTSTTFRQTGSAVSDRSKLCLSCHDGTIALGQTLASGDLAVRTPLGTASNLTADLRRDHPFGFDLPAQDDGEIRSWLRTAPITPADAAVQVFDDRVECVTCHDPHVPNRDASVTKFLVRSNDSGGLCLTCHDPARGALNGWLAGQHANATNTVGANAAMPYTTVATNACAACHTSHNAVGGGARLLRASEEAACLNCHSSTSVVAPAATDIQSVLANATYRHPVLEVSGAHDPAETLPVNAARHAECFDCHLAHAAQAASAATTPPNVGLPQLGVAGVSATDGSTIAPAANQYQICFKCHAASTNKPQKSGYDASYGRTAVRQSFAGLADPYNTAFEFNSSISRHNVVQTLRAANVPSLRANMLDLSGNPVGRSLTAYAYIYCVACHASERARASGGTGANGPHGSRWPHILERDYEVNAPPAIPGDVVTTVTYVAGANGPYALCDKCHDVDGKLVNGGDTVFGLHNRHVAKDGMACSSCHASHGVQGADAAHHGSLIDPDTAIVGPPPAASGAGDSYINTRSRTCNLTCHGKAHVNVAY